MGMLVKLINASTFCGNVPSVVSRTTSTARKAVESTVKNRARKPPFPDLRSARTPARRQRRFFRTIPKVL